MTLRDTIADTSDNLFNDVSWLALSPDDETLYAVNYGIPGMAVIDVDAAVDGIPGSITGIEGPVDAPGADAAYLNSVVASGNAFYVAVDGPNYDGTTVMRYPVAPTVDPLTTATPGSTVAMSGSALVGADVTIGGVPATTVSSSYSGVTVRVPDLSSIPSSVDVPVVVTTDSGAATAQVDVTTTSVIPRIIGAPRVGSVLTAVPGSGPPGPGSATSGSPPASPSPVPARARSRPRPPTAARPSRCG
ncbi:IPT/TIG domain-containing protein [Aeromicrobium sp. UC242_57]|uniref:IPT/TIG domain-containing protein n=1 Tax=Aeromicrobium sp. UC242_57 TaxID=3374624 RepID=UPI00378CDAD6